MKNKYNIGDLFVRERPVKHETMVAYVSKTDRNAHNYLGYYLHFIFTDGTIDRRYYNTEGIKGLLILGWKHYPVKE